MMTNDDRETLCCYIEAEAGQCEVRGKAEASRMYRALAAKIRRWPRCKPPGGGRMDDYATYTADTATIVTKPPIADWREQLAREIEAEAKIGNPEAYQDGLIRAAQIVREMPAESPWIGVEDRMPGTDEHVLAWNGENWWEVYYHERRWQTDVGYLAGVTFWMPVTPPWPPAAAHTLPRPPARTLSPT